MRDRLIELLQKRSCFYNKNKCNAHCSNCDYVTIDDNDIGKLADHLLANGVVVLPCKVGQLAYCIIRGTYHCQMMHGTVSQVKVSKDGGSFYVSINGYFGQHYTFTDVGKNVFFTREEAERALKNS